jgi:replication factor C subunit 3/5
MNSDNNDFEDVKKKKSKTTKKPHIDVIDNDDNCSDNDDFFEDFKKKKTKKSKTTKNTHIDVMAMHNNISEFLEEFKVDINEKPKINKEHLPWVERFRPAKLTDIVGHDIVVNSLKRLVMTKQCPNLVISGPPGTGKTSAIMAVARDFYIDNYALMVLDINASEERRVDVMRTKVKNFISTKGVFMQKNQASFKLVILDEADAMTAEAQSTLKHIMEKHIGNVRFCLIGNYVEKIRRQIRSRCTQFRLPPLKKKDIEKKIQEIADEIGFTIDQSAMNRLIKISKGDMRKVINTLQATYMAYKKVTLINISKCGGLPLPDHINEINEILLSKNIKNCYNEILELINDHGYSLIDVIHDLFDLHMDMYINNKSKNIDMMTLISNMRDIEVNLTMCQNENIQLAGLVSAFALAKKK